MCYNTSFLSRGDLKMQSTILKIIVGLIVFTLVNTRVYAGDQIISQYFAEITKKTPELYAFLRAMPKGGDLHSHMVGSAYSEEYIEWGIKEKMCVELATKRITNPPCDKRAGKPLLKHAVKNLGTYASLVDALSTRNHHLGDVSGATQFFGSFAGFDAVTETANGPAYGLASAVKRAADQNILYLELMFSEGMRAARKLGKTVKWHDNPIKLRQELMDSGIRELAKKTRSVYDKMEKNARTILNCSAKKTLSQKNDFCGVQVRYIASLKRIVPKEQLFAELVHAFELVKTDPRIVGINLVGPEDAPITLKNYRQQMELIGSLKKIMPDVSVTLHAGELKLGMVPPRYLRSHIRDAVKIAQAQRIGHGIDVMHENDPYQLLQMLVDRDVLIEINLTSNDIILGVKGEDHPFPTYLKYGVPVTLSTDDEGVARINLTHEYLRAAQSYNLTYDQIKAMSRNSLSYSFAPGKRLWRSNKYDGFHAECADQKPHNSGLTNRCARFLQKNPKAALQWQLEQNYINFEGDVAKRIK
jgi:adenosine deaminase/adenosine deaminase CECR1